MVQWGLFDRATYEGLGLRAQYAESLGKEGEVRHGRMCSVHDTD
jgi:hypothetical protein